jgi:hypothetical protein
MAILRRGRLPPLTGETEHLLLVAGLPRSGTTWLGKIFDSHPSVLYRHEPDSIFRTRGIPAFNAAPYKPDVLEAARAYLLKLSEIRTIKTIGVVPIFSKPYFSKPALALHKVLIAGFKLGERLPILGPHVKTASVPDLRTAGNKVSIVIKSIDALGRIGLFMAACPILKTILIVRHPHGYVASVMRGIRMKKFEASVPTTEDMGLYELLAETHQARNLGIDFAAFKAMHSIERLAWHWTICNSMAMTALNGCQRGCVIRYEDLCEDPMHVSRTLISFAGLSWTKDTEHFVTSSTTFSGTETYYQVLRDTKKAPQKWRSELTAAEIEVVSRVAERSQTGRSFMKDWPV